VIKAQYHKGSGAVFRQTAKVPSKLL